MLPTTYPQPNDGVIMPEAADTLLSRLEATRLPDTQLYYPDPELVKELLTFLTENQIEFGVEIGPGDMPTDLGLIDSRVPYWLLYEMDQTAIAVSRINATFRTFKGSRSTKLIYVRDCITNGFSQLDGFSLPSVIVYRNPDEGRLDYLPSPTDYLKRGGRVVVISDNLYSLSPYRTVDYVCEIIRSLHDRYPRFVETNVCLYPLADVKLETNPGLSTHVYDSLGNDKWKRPQ